MLTKVSKYSSVTLSLLIVPLSLINLYTGVLYNLGYSVKNNKIQNGSRLVLI